MTKLKFWLISPLKLQCKTSKWWQEPIYGSMMMKNFVCYFFTKLHPFFTYEWGGGNKIVWANLLTTIIYQGGFTIKGNSLLFGNVVATFWGGLGVGQKFSEAIFNITRPVRLLSYPHFFCQGQNPAPFLAMPVFSLLLKVLVLHQPFQ